MPEIHTIWLESLRRTWPKESPEAWEDVLSERLVAVPFELAGGFSTDAVDPSAAIPLDRDHLGVRSYVTMFATLVAERQTPMPLSIGLFGDWGSGQELLHGLAARAGRSALAIWPTADHENIRQIGFNAWHYADTNLWASLGQHIFDQLLGPANPGEEQREALQKRLVRTSRAAGA